MSALLCNMKNGLSLYKYMPGHIFSITDYSDWTSHNNSFDFDLFACVLDMKVKSLIYKVKQKIWTNIHFRNIDEEKDKNADVRRLSAYWQRFLNIHVWVMMAMKMGF